MTKKTMIVIGATGQLGGVMADYFDGRVEVIRFDRSRLDLCDLDAIGPGLEGVEFDLMLNCSAMTDVDGCERNPELAGLINTEVPLRLGAVCRERGAKMVHIGTDYVFSGDATVPYTETSLAEPISVYGKTKLAGEEGVLEQDDEALVVRTSLLYSMRRPGFPEWLIGEARRTHEALRIVGDKVANLTRVEELPALLEELLNVPEDAHGLFNVVNTGHGSPAEQAIYILKRAMELDISLRTTEVEVVPMSAFFSHRAPRPKFSALDTSKYTASTGHEPPSWEEAMDRHLDVIAAGFGG